jgi:hypothetical protein
MDRAWRRSGYLLLLGVVLSAAGCSAFTGILYVMGANDAPAEYKGLKGKKVAVVCRPITSLRYQDSRVAADLSVMVGKLLRDNSKTFSISDPRKIEIIDPRKIDKWCDENTWDEYVEVGKAVAADVVLAIDLEHFDIYQGQTLYQGRASTTLRVYNCKDGEILFEKTSRQTVYPPNSCVATSEKEAPQFRREFLKVLADQIARVFYAHDPYADTALDAAAM